MRSTLGECELLHQIDDCLDSSLFTRAQGTFNSDWKRSKYMEKNLPFVSSVTYDLGIGARHKRSTFEYIPIMKNLQAIFDSDQDCLSHLMQPDLSCGAFMGDHCDGRLYKEKESILAESPCIDIFMYTDDFEVCNPIGAYRKKHKICAIYYVIGNFHPAVRSRTASIQLALVCRSRDVKEFGIDKVLMPMLEDLKELERVGVEIQGVSRKVRGRLCFVSGDNLASHLLGGFQESFGPTVLRPCRYCMCTNQEFKVQFDVSRLQARTPALYRYHVSRLTEDPQAPSLFGVKRDSILNSLQFFHVTEGLPPDPMHDLLEGVVKYELGLVLQKLAADGYATLSELNAAIEQGPYGSLDSVNKPMPLQQLSADGVKLNAARHARVWCLLRLLPLMIGTKIPLNTPAWQILLMLREITEIVLAPKVAVPHLALLDGILRDHAELFTEVFPGAPFKPKQHYILHYPQLTVDFGPLRSVWCMRYEAKHYFFKMLVNCLHNFKSICKTLAYRHLMQQAYFLSNGFLQGKGTIEAVGKSKRELIDLCDETLLSRLQTLGICTSQVQPVEHAVVNGLTYRRGMFVVVDYCNDSVVFGKISAVLICGNVAAVVVDKHTSRYEEHLGCYELIHMGMSDVVDCKDLVDWYPLTSYNTAGMQYISLKHMIIDAAEFVY